MTEPVAKLVIELDALPTAATPLTYRSEWLCPPDNEAALYALARLTVRTMKRAGITPALIAMAIDEEFKP